MIELRPFQEKALEQYRRSFGRSNAHLGIAPTAFGKSILMGYLAARMAPMGWRIIIIAHREALVDQNAKKVLLVNGGLVVGREIQKEKANGSEDVISASIATLRDVRLYDFCERVKLDKRKIFLMTDEAHHALADSYRALIEALKPDQHLGLTATPFRADGESLDQIFPEVGFQISRGEMIDGGWLAHPMHAVVRTDQSLAGVKSKMGDYVEGQLAKALNVEDRNQLIVAAAKEIRDELEDRIGQRWFRGVCFAINVEHAHTLAAMFNDAGFEAYAIDGKTPIPDRRHADDRLRSAEAHVILVSCGVLTEGWDVEECNVGLFARPTKSSVLADQMLGRVLRWKADKQKSVVIDFEDSEGKDRVSIASSFTLPARWDAMGVCLREDELWFGDKVKTADILLASNLWQCTCRAEVEAIFRNPENCRPRKLPRDYSWWNLGLEFRMISGLQTLVVSQRPQGDWKLELRAGVQVEHIDNTPLLDIALAKGERIAEEREMKFTKNWVSAEAPTEAQLQMLKKMGKFVPPNATRSDVADIISLEKMTQLRALENGVWMIGTHKGTHIKELPDQYVTHMLDTNWAWLGQRPDGQLLEQEAQRRGLR